VRSICRRVVQSIIVGGERGEREKEVAQVCKRKGKRARQTRLPFFARGKEKKRGEERSRKTKATWLLVFSEKERRALGLCCDLMHVRKVERKKRGRSCDEFGFLTSSARGKGERKRGQAAEGGEDRKGATASVFSV